MTAKRYEAVIIFDPELDERGVAAESDAVEEFIRSRDGVVEKRDSWGKLELAFPIKKKSYGTYVLFVFSASGSLVSALERQQRLSDRVLRWMVVEKDKNVPDWTPERLSERRRLPDPQSDAYEERKPREETAELI